MAMPKSVVKIRKNGVEFTESVDRANYLITELSRAALRDVGKFIAKRTRQQIRKRTGRLTRSIQYWVRKKETDLQVGFKPTGWYGLYQELGTENQPKIGALFNATNDNIKTIREIESQYLSAIEDELNAQALIDESEELSNEN